MLILRKVIKVVANTCHILKLKCTKFDFCWGSARNPASGAGSRVGKRKGKACVVAVGDGRPWTGLFTF